MNNIKDKFVPERLLGVQTNKGFILLVGDCYWSEYGFGVVVRDKGWYLPCWLRYYISDESDETVSFENYVKLFYNTEDTL